MIKRKCTCVTVIADELVAWFEMKVHFSITLSPWGPA